MTRHYFTLLELLIVTLLIAILAGGVVVSISGASNQAQSDIVLHRSGVLYNALIQFKKDMGYYPKAAGQLDLSNVENPIPSTSAEIPDNWFNNTQNFNQLFERPINRSKFRKAKGL